MTPGLTGDTQREVRAVEMGSGRQKVLIDHPKIQKGTEVYSLKSKISKL